MANYTFELGVDWNAIESGGSYFLPYGYVRDDDPPGMASPMWPPLDTGDTLSFRVFDITVPQVPVTPTSLQFTHQRADGGTEPAESEWPSLGDPSVQRSLTFGGDLRCWSSRLLTIRAGGRGVFRYLLTFTVWATLDGMPRRYVVDPEMAVGPNGIPDDCDQALAQGEVAVGGRVTSSR